MKAIGLFISIAVAAASCGSSTDRSERSGPVSEDPGTEIAEEADMTSHPGYTVYRQHCLPCHQADGNGVPGMHPSLHGTEYVNGDRDRLIGIILHGMTGEIEVNGEIFNSIMAPLPYLSDKEIADVLTFVRKSFGNDSDAITPEEVAAVRNSG